jgi:hypothetical protein
MAARKLAAEHKEVLLTWLAADYTSDLIRRWFEERGWPQITRQAIDHYRERQRPAILARREERHARALASGLALKEERVERLKEHADQLEGIKWVPDEKGRLWNEKAWRETLDDIAREMGQRKLPVDVNVGNLSDEELVRRTTRALAGDGPAGTDPAEPGE